VNQNARTAFQYVGDGLVAAHRVRAVGRDAERSHAGVTVLVPGSSSSFEVTYRLADSRNRTVTVRGPLLAVIPAAQPYALSFRRACALTLLELPLPFMTSKAIEAGIRHPLVIARRYAILDPFLRAVAEALCATLRGCAAPDGEQLDALADVTAVHIALTHVEAPRPTGEAGLSVDKVEEVKTFVRGNIDEALPVNRLAAHVGLSAFHFARSFRTATGQSPHAFVTAERLARARALLRDTDLPLVEVAMSVGYQTQGHFTVLFHRHQGETPRAYRLRAGGARGH